jgi:hypothetical protein
MGFFTTSVTGLKTVVTAIGAGVGVWGVINLLEGYGNDNPGANAHVTLRSSNKRQGQMLHAIPYSPRIDSKKTGNNS